MKNIIISTVAAAGLALVASSAFAHGHVVTGPEVYATVPAQPVTRNHLVGKSDNGIEGREFRAVQHGTHWLQNGDDY